MRYQGEVEGDAIVFAELEEGALVNWLHLFVIMMLGMPKQKMISLKNSTAFLVVIVVTGQLLPIWRIF